jgi:hypothetical protein
MDMKTARRKNKTSLREVAGKSARTTQSEHYTIRAPHKPQQTIKLGNTDITSWPSVARVRWDRRRW